MPVSAVAPNASAPPAVAPSTPPSAAQSASFAAALDTATARFDPARLPTVSIGQMVQAIANPDPERTADLVAGASSPVGTASSASVMTAASLPADGAGAKILAAGERYLGVPYKWGGTSATGLDCSGFVQRAFGDLGISLPRVSVDQAKAGQPVASLAQARPGDLVFWYGDGKRPNHIGIYAGDNKMLVAPRTGDVVKYQELSRTPHEIRRIV